MKVCQINQTVSMFKYRPLLIHFYKFTFYQTDFHTITQSMQHVGAKEIQTSFLSGIFDENQPIVVRSQFGLQLFEIKSSGWKYKVFTIKNKVSKKIINRQK